MNVEISHNVVRHEVELEYIQKELRELRQEVKQISSILNEAKGSWKALIGVGSLASALTVAGAKMLGWLAPH